MTSGLSLILTRDGSHSFFSERFNDSYHSLHGAVQESNHVFIKHGLEYLAKTTNEIKLLELGLGTGLNFILSYEYVKTRPELTLYYESWEAYPVPKTMSDQLQYGRFLESNDLINIHDLSWNTTHRVSPQVTLNKQLKHFEELDRDQCFNLIFHDAFAPQKQPYLWQESFLEKIAKSAQKDAILVTYCAQGEFRRALTRLGFDVHKLPGPPGKREMVRAIKQN
ncbi:MAG: tRNA (5-methylaminomethyl-2-thiouridine)(34)-methyltransferase MnmD [Saprospiraceae bacterium]|nr:tRNA (5-methylaminomethyl-2-thiouridine)(34)-methyltransferase MnmD [Saprospiraceae bacterium]